MIRPRHRVRRRAEGQILVIMVLSIVVLLMGAGLIIDGGNAFAQLRRAQNGADAAAEAGAVQLARKISGVTITNAEVAAAIAASATENGLTAVPLSEYTNIDGLPIGPVGTSGPVPSNAQGVKVGGDIAFGTYLARVVGQDQWTATADATAITGYAEDSGLGGLIPLTFPILLTECTTGGGSSKLVFPDDGTPPLGLEWPFGPENRIAIPLCSNGPGNVGWIDWSGGGGGAAEVADYIRGVKPNPSISTPHWYEVTETGAITSLDDDMDIWEGKDITIPIFHAEADDPGTVANEELKGTCDAEPTGTKDLLNDCPAGDIGANGQGWYFLTSFGVFHLEHAYIQGNFQSECNAGRPTLVSPASPPTEANPVKQCLIGYFKDRVVAKNMTVGSSTPFNAFTPLAIQLID
jgi:Putative Flp pilus-assembly TadE/G-like